MTFRVYFWSLTAVIAAYSLGLGLGIRAGVKASKPAVKPMTEACLAEVDELQVDIKGWQFLCAAIEAENVPQWPGRMPR
jgi:hypothetical protein